MNPESNSPESVGIADYIKKYEALIEEWNPEIKSSCSMEEGCDSCQ